MFIVNGHFYIEIKSNGKVLPYPPGTFDYIMIIQNTLQLLPTLTIELNDSSYLAQRDFPMVDGTPLSVKMGTINEKEAPIEMRFRVISTPRMTAFGSGSRQRIKAILDCDKIFSVPDKSYKGTSADVISEIAKECGLNPETDITNDSMTWLPLRKKLGQFMYAITDYAWSDDKSFFAMGITDTHKLRLKNISLLKKEEPKVQIFYSENPPQSQIGTKIQATNFEFSSVSGYSNTTFNYGMRSVQDKMDGSANEYTKLEVDKNSNFLEMSKNSKSKVGIARSFGAPIDLGNTHEKFEKARYQNKRSAATYGVRANIQLGNPSTAELLDLINLYTPRSRGDANDMFNGNYILTAKTRLVTGNVYTEKVTLVSQGRGLDPNGELQ